MTSSPVKQDNVVLSMSDFETLNNERISLLCRSNRLSLNEEVRLITLNDLVSTMCPRYTKEDWAILEEAEELIEELREFNEP